MEAEENLELRITDIAHGGYGVARENGQVIFVGGAIPGEKVRVQIFERKRRFAKAVVQEVLEAAPERIENPWPAGGVAYTGAADFAHIALPSQRELKAQVVAAQLRKIGGEIITAQLADLPLVVEAVDSSDGWGSRSRIDLVKMPQGFGMYRAHSHELLPLQEMPLADARIESLDLWGGAWDKYVPVGAKVRAVASSGGDIRLAVGKKVYSAPGKRAARTVREQVLLPGESDSQTQKNYRYALDAAGFWQVHREAPRTLIMAVQDFLGDISGVRGVDLYAGAGLFSQPLADCIGPRGSLSTYEGSREAVKAAQKNLAAFPWAKAQEVRIGARNIQKLTAQADFVLADPPRAGLGVAAAQQLAKSGAEKIVLVSCDPAAMARDVAQLAAGGYRMTGIHIFDIFPHTHHVESVILLTKTHK
ncbi:class I SAM-dependent RNA methyltransferase [uncultured Arcanobacterium sp.]|uniref:class I SAM-dependent RNA methyltransferase n=1 Tax=uncultured Arcanobacterium sp. TaxID=487520 RepID=UPI00261F8C47|nr:TRAM domain-containing protein [uncultured Arcanobacterium sp.]